MADQFDYRFWAAVGGATLFKLATSPNHSLTRTAITVGAAIFSAWLFTDPLLHFMGWEPESYRNAAAGLMALIGEGAMRWLIRVTPEKLISIWRGEP